MHETDSRRQDRGRQQPVARGIRRGGDVGVRHPGRHRVRAHPDEGGNAQKIEGGAPASGTRRHLRLLLRVCRRDLRAAAPRATVRAALQGLRGGARAGSAERAASGSPRHVRIVSRRAGIRLSAYRRARGRAGADAHVRWHAGIRASGPCVRSCLQSRGRLSRGPRPSPKSRDRNVRKTILELERPVGRDQPPVPPVE